MSATSFFCLKCNETCNGRPEYHQQKCHQLKVTVNYPDGTSQVLVRDEDSGKFTCRCGSLKEAAASMSRHARTCNRPPVTLSPQPISEEAGPPLLPLATSKNIQGDIPGTEEGNISDIIWQAGTMPSITRNPPKAESVQGPPLPSGEFSDWEVDFGELEACEETPHVQPKGRPNERDMPFEPFEMVERQEAEPDIDAMEALNEAETMDGKEIARFQGIHDLDPLSWEDINCEYEERLQSIVCLRCKLLIPSEDLSTHFSKNHHNYCNGLGLTRIMDLIQESGLLPSTDVRENLLSIHRNFLRFPIDGLTIIKGRKCKICSVKYLETRDEMTRHLREQHESTNSQEDWEHHRFQVLFYGNKRRNIGVGPGEKQSGDSGESDIDSSHNQLLSAFLTEMQEEERSGGLQDVGGSSDARVRNAFIDQVQWHEALEGFDRKQLFQLSQAPIEGDVLYSIFAYTTVYFAQVSAYIESANVLLRRFIMSTGDEVSNEVFKKLQEASSMVAYSRMFGRFICFLLRSVSINHPWLEKYPLSALQLEAIQEVREMFKDSFAEPGSMYRSFHGLCFSLVGYHGQITEDMSGDLSFPIYRFLIVASLQETGHFIHLRLITPIISKLQWCLRATVLQEARFRIKEKEATFVQLMDDLRPFVQENHFTSFNTLRQAMHLGCSVLAGTPVLPKIIWLKGDYSALAIGGNKVTLESIKNFAHMQLDRVKAALESLFLGLSLPATEWDPKAIVDELRNTDHEYSLFSTERNPFYKNRYALLVGILKNRRLSRKYSCLVEGKTVWKDVPGLAWLREAQKCFRILSTLMHTTYGQPARGTELMTVRLRNSGDMMRGVFWTAGTLALVCTYSKTRSLHGRDSQIPRFLPQEVAKVMVTYLAFIRPVEVLLVKHILPEQIRLARSMEDFLFSDFKSQWESKTISEIMSVEMAKHGPAALSLKDYRHVATAFMEKHIKYRQWHGASSVLDLQAGHSSTTAAINYAVSNEDMEHIQRNQFFAFQKASLEWHKLLGFEVTELEGNCCSPMPFQEPGIQQLQTALFPMAELLERVKALLQTEFKELKRELTAPTKAAPSSKRRILDSAEEETDSSSPVSQFIPLSEAHQSSRPMTPLYRTLDPPGSEVGDGFPSTPSPQKMSSPESIVSQFREKDIGTALVGLRILYKDPKAQFKSVAQMAAVLEIIRRKRDVLVVLPTGGGKSVLYMILPFLEPDRTTVVVAPQVAVLKDIRQRCGNLGVSCREWPREVDVTSPTAAGLILVGVEHYTRADFKNYLLKLDSKDQLSRIVVEECHLVLTQESFREDMSKVRERLSTKAPMVLVTGTLPPSDEAPLQKAAGCEDNLLVVRVPTFRPNLVYGVSDLGGKVNQLIPALIPVLVKRSSALKTNERGIVYTREVSECMILCDELKKAGTECVRYYGTQTKEEKQRADQSWREGRAKVMVATSAFGLGVDHPSVRWVVHYGAVNNLFDYIQQTGRAGRDGGPAECLLYTNQDYLKECKWLEKRTPKEWREVREYIQGEDVCRREAISRKMDGAGTSCFRIPGAGLCDVCSSIVDSLTTVPSTPREFHPSTAVANNVAISRARHLQDVASAGEVMEMMSELRNQCSLCIFRRQWSSHRISQCPDIGEGCVRCLSTQHTYHHCAKYQFPVGSCCYGCCRPLRFHGVPIRGVCAVGSDCDGHKDRVTLLCWAAWRDGVWRGEMEKDFGEAWPTEDAFRRWIQSSTGTTQELKYPRALTLAVYIWKKMKE